MANDSCVQQTEVPYRYNMLGSIASHLAGLQGYDVMALELIQNADDARAEELVFDIRPEGLYVSNSGQFTYCGNLFNIPCKLKVEGEKLRFSPNN